MSIKISDPKDVSKTSKIWLSAKYNHVRKNESYEDQKPFGGQISVRLGYNQPISDSEEAASLISGLLAPLFTK